MKCPQIYNLAGINIKIHVHSLSVHSTQGKNVIEATWAETDTLQLI